MSALAPLPRSVVLSSLRLLALLGLTALGACDLSQDCSFAPSKCPTIELSDICLAAGQCKVDGAPAVCAQGSCSLSPGQKLTVKLESSKVTASTPDLVIHFATVRPSPKEVHLLFDGVEIATEDETGTGDLQVKWTASAPSPKTLELSFSKGTEATEVEFTFRDLDCESSERSACHGGGE